MTVINKMDCWESCVGQNSSPKLQIDKSLMARASSESPWFSVNECGQGLVSMTQTVPSLSPEEVIKGAPA
jgi:hypothetical protein